MSKLDKIKGLIKKRLEEESATGTGASFTAGTGENYATPVAGKAKNYYYKLGYKPVNQKALNKAAKGIEVKQLWEEQTAFDIESYIATLPTDDEEVKKYIAGRLGDYNALSDKLKQLITLNLAPYADVFIRTLKQLIHERLDGEGKYLNRWVDV